MLVFNYSKLKGKIIEVCGTQGVFAEKMGLSERTISLKLANKIFFKQDEMVKALEILNIPLEELELYFFDAEVQNI